MFRLGTLLVLTRLATLFYTGTARADTLTAANTKGSGEGSPGAAIRGANYAAGDAGIVFAKVTKGTITLSSTLPPITDPEWLTIDRSGKVTVGGNEALRVFVMGHGAALSLKNLAVSGGLALDRGGVHNNDGDLAAETPTFSRNLSGDNGGAIYNDEGACPPPGADQRDVARSQGEACDSGGFELVRYSQRTGDSVPKPDAVSPTEGTDSVARGINPRATFSEEMAAATIGTSTFNLYQVDPDGTTTRVTNASVTLSKDGLSTTLDPYGSPATRLAKNTRHKAVVATGAKDLAGNALDRNATKDGNQHNAWYFTTAGWPDVVREGRSEPSRSRPPALLGVLPGAGIGRRGQPREESRRGA